jgi:hypothetical protein
MVSEVNVDGKISMIEGVEEEEYLKLFWAIVD